jgi:hypothetical protein
MFGHQARGGNRRYIAKKPKLPKAILSSQDMATPSNSSLRGLQAAARAMPAHVSLLRAPGQNFKRENRLPASRVPRTSACQRLSVAAQSRSCQGYPRRLTPHCGTGSCGRRKAACRTRKRRQHSCLSQCVHHDQVEVQAPP